MISAPEPWVVHEPARGETGLQFESADLSLLGNREENQDRVVVATSDDATLVLAVDGMGGHMDGARAAELTSEIVRKEFDAASHPIFDPQGFLHLAIGKAHDALIKLGEDLSIEARPRATCAACLIQDGAAYWGHVGDSRIYHLRGQQIQERSRDHSHVETLLQEGLIDESEIADHPMRNFVECCLGGDAPIPDMSITVKMPLVPGDVLLACSDGLWSGIADSDIAEIAAPGENNLAENLKALSIKALNANSPYSDNTTGTAIRWLEP